MITLDVLRSKGKAAILIRRKERLLETFEGD